MPTPTGSSIDVWILALQSHHLGAAVVCVDGLKAEIETKLLLGCTDLEIEVIRRFHSEGQQSAHVLQSPDSA